MVIKKWNSNENWMAYTPGLALGAIFTWDISSHYFDDHGLTDTVTMIGHRTSSFQGHIRYFLAATGPGYYYLGLYCNVPTCKLYIGDTANPICVGDTTLTCPVGQYNDSSYQCLKCQPLCTSCLSFSYCTGCIVGYYVNSGTCTRIFFLINLLIVLACPICTLCTSNTGCVSCPTTPITNVGGVCSCPPGTTLSSGTCISVSTLSLTQDTTLSDYCENITLNATVLGAESDYYSSFYFSWYASSNSSNTNAMDILNGYLANLHTKSIKVPYSLLEANISYTFHASYLNAILTNISASFVINPFTFLNPTISITTPSPIKRWMENT